MLSECFEQALQQAAITAARLAVPERVIDLERPPARLAQLQLLGVRKQHQAAVSRLADEKDRASNHVLRNDAHEVRIGTGTGNLRLHFRDLCALSAEQLAEPLGGKYVGGRRL